MKHITNNSSHATYNSIEEGINKKSNYDRKWTLPFWNRI